MTESKLSNFVTFNDQKLARRYANKKMPMETFYSAYFNGDLDFSVDVNKFLDHRHDLISWKLTTGHLRWILTNFIPEVAIHSKRQDKRIVQDHYDRGNDFFGWFLGERMVYTSGFFQNPNESLEQAQDNKIKLVLEKVQLKKGESLLDIGCGWGTLARHAARDFGANATGVTISKNQVSYANERIRKEGLQDSARVLLQDYREIPSDQKFDKIVSLEMVEHVGVKNVRSYYNQVFELLKDDGLFLLQWTGLRRAMKPEDLIWGLFMNKYIFPGADASLCCFAMLKHMEKTNFEIHSVENVTIHYGLTIKKWHDNWLSNRKEITKAYGDRWFRIWHLFLAWSIRVCEHGNAACFQVILNKNQDKFNRRRWIGQNFSLGERARLNDARRDPPAPAPSLGL